MIAETIPQILECKAEICESVTKTLSQFEEETKSTVRTIFCDVQFCQNLEREYLKAIAIFLDGSDNPRLVTNQVGELLQELEDETSLTVYGVTVWRDLDEEADSKIIGCDIDLRLTSIQF